uniref:aminoglycoside 6-adenylyltransferase n=1 Tax=Pedobacter schmidteae TaxID=2201271 RepID=UPI000EB5A675|nr:aminoglycoside 6-adenylyltransferase [Pedobacter schmidteae]
MTSRNEQQMMQLIMDVATNDSRIRAVLLNGSRANPNVKKDIFQDFDIVYAVTDMDAFIQNPGWIDVFGERMILQTPEDMELYPPDDELEGAYSYLMQFLDGNRIDLTLVPTEKFTDFIQDSLSILLMDKDGITKQLEIPDAGEASYLTKRPTERSFHDCCNEFWYTNSGLAKALWRQQVPYTKWLFHHVIQPALMQMLDWHIGCSYDFKVNPGKAGKFYNKYLEPELYEKLLLTYTNASTADTWKATYDCIELFRDTAMKVAAQLGYTYPLEEDEKVVAYLKHVQHLPKEAKGIYQQ